LFLKAGAKVENLFLTGKCFLKFFLKNFRFHFFFLFTNLSMNFPCFAGCKCNIRFQISQAFWNLFLKKNFQYQFVCLSVFRGTLVAVAGAKVPPLFTFTRLFFIKFQPFAKLFLNSLITQNLAFQVFYPF